MRLAGLLLLQQSYKVDAETQTILPFGESEGMQTSGSTTMPTVCTLFQCSLELGPKVWTGSSQYWYVGTSSEIATSSVWTLKLLNVIPLQSVRVF